MSTEKLIIYGAVAFAAWTLFNRQQLRVNNGRVTGMVRPTPGANRATENQINARTALDLAYGIKGLFTGGATSDKPGSTVGLDESLDQGREKVILTDDLRNTDNWAANPWDAY